jgi:hypothetical protein
MKVMEALTRLVIATSRFGDYLLSRKVSSIIVATLALGCGAGLVYALKGEPRTACAVVAVTMAADPARAEVNIRDTPGDGAEEEDPVIDGGSYENYVYGYSVKLPAGMVGMASPPPAPQHGFGIDLDNPRSTDWIHEPDFPKSYLYVDGCYNSMEYAGVNDAVRSHLSALRENGKNVRVLSRTATSLGGLRAARVVTHYEEDGEEMVSDEVVAIGGGADVVFTLALSTPLSKYERDKSALEALRNSWCLQPVE